MPLGYNYKKNFIILREEEKGYEIASGKNPTGYVKIEFKKDKANINGFVQNIAASEKSDYKLLLLNTKEKQIYQVGNLRMGYSGGGEIRAQTNLKDNSDMDEYSSALVITGDKVILFGSNEKRGTDWKEWFYGKYLYNDTVVAPIVNKNGGTIDKDIRTVETKELTEDLNVVEKEVMVEAESDDKKMTAEETIEFSAEKLPDEMNEPEKVLGAEKSIGKINVTETKKAEDIEEVVEILNEEEFNEIEKVQIVSKVEIAEEVKGSHESNYTSKETGEKIICELTEKIYIDPGFEEENYNKYCVNSDIKEMSNEEIKKNSLVALINRLRKIEGIEGENNRQWYAIDDNINILNDIATMMFGGKMPLSYLYLAEGCSILIKNSILGIELYSGKVVKVFVGIPGIYNRFWEIYFRSKGFTEYLRLKGGQQGYWVLNIDMEGINTY
ncbi:MAG: hypothetical protein M0P77_08675 [Firmicutes bacterium]|nr:hypothetical protein [Bacillota bacterium]